MIETWRPIDYGAVPIEAYAWSACLIGAVLAFVLAMLDDD